MKAGQRKTRMGWHGVESMAMMPEDGWIKPRNEEFISLAKGTWGHIGQSIAFCNHKKVKNSSSNAYCQFVIKRELDECSHF